jgi:hypothetical protein
MKITLEQRHPTPSHCDLAVFVNGANAGTLTLRLEEMGPFLQIIGGKPDSGDSLLVPLFIGEWSRRGGSQWRWDSSKDKYE